MSRAFSLTLSKIVSGVKQPDTGRTVSMRDLDQNILATATETPAGSGAYYITGFSEVPKYAYWYIDAIQRPGYSNNSPFWVGIYDSVSGSSFFSDSLQTNSITSGTISALSISGDEFYGNFNITDLVVGGITADSISSFVYRGETYYGDLFIGGTFQGDLQSDTATIQVLNVILSAFTDNLIGKGTVFNAQPTLDTNYFGYGKGGIVWMKPQVQDSVASAVHTALAFHPGWYMPRTTAGGPYGPPASNFGMGAVGAFEPPGATAPSDRIPPGDPGAESRFMTVYGTSGLHLYSEGDVILKASVNNQQVGEPSHNQSLCNSQYFDFGIPSVYVEAPFVPNWTVNIHNKPKKFVALTSSSGSIWAATISYSKYDFDSAVTSEMDFNLDPTTGVTFINATTQSVTALVPPASGWTVGVVSPPIYRQRFATQVIFKRTDSSANSVTLKAKNNDLIDGLSAQTLGPLASITMITDSTNWWIV